MSHEDLAVRVGKSRSAISNTLRLLKLPNNIQQFLANGDITSGHARALLSIEDPEHMAEMADRIISQKMNVRDIEESVQKLKVTKQGKSTSSKAKPAPARDPDLSAVLEKMQYRLGTQVKIVGKTDEKGKIEIYFFSNDDLNRIIELLS